MSGRRTRVRWPIWGSAWALIAALLAIGTGRWALVVCAGLAIVAFWGHYAAEDKS